MVVNNGVGFEMKFPSSWGCGIASAMKVSEDDYVCASGHYAAPGLLKSYVRGLGFEYLSADDKTSYMQQIESWLDRKDQGKPMIFEVFVNSEDEDIALNSIMSIMADNSNIAKAALKKIVGKKGINAIKKAIKG